MAFTVRADENETNDIDNLKEIFGVKTAAKALLLAAKALPLELKKNKEAVQRISELEDEIYGLKYKINNYKSAQESLFKSTE